MLSLTSIDLFQVQAVDVWGSANRDQQLINNHLFGHAFLLDFDGDLIACG